MSFQEGWGRGTWGLGSWGTPLYVNVDLTGVASTVGLGDPVIDAGAVVQVTSVGAVASELGTLAFNAKAFVYPNGFGITSAQGTAIARAGADVIVSGFQMNTAFSGVEIIATAAIIPTGIAVEVGLRPPLVYGEIDTTQSPNYTEIPPARDAA
ncbi:MAG TPA: hypothetical protein VIG24_16355 [Acidimicrobiia bacterium]